jgi:hypothetical protein
LIGSDPGRNSKAVDYQAKTAPSYAEDLLRLRSRRYPGFIPYKYGTIKDDHFFILFCLTDSSRVSPGGMGSEYQKAVVRSASI